MPIQWREQMSVGITEVDADHQHLIGIINEFEGAARRGAGQVDEGNMRAILGKLQRYTRDHFAREEKMQEAAGYDGLAENRSQHGALLARLHTLVVQYTEGKLGATTEATEVVTSFLNRWLVDHILKTDLKMRGRVSPKP